MGTPIDPPIDPPPPDDGEPCPICWGEGNAFGDFPTPLEITVTISGVVDTGGDASIFNGTFVLTQNDLPLSCQWNAEIMPDVGLIVAFFEFQSVAIIVLGGFLQAWQALGGKCVTLLEGQDFTDSTGGSLRIHF